MSVLDRHMSSEKKTKDLMADGWKWKVRDSRKLPEKEPHYRRSLYDPRQCYDKVSIPATLLL